MTERETIEVPRALLDEIMAALATSEDLLKRIATQREVRRRVGAHVGSLHDLHQQLQTELLQLDRTFSELEGRSMAMFDASDQLREELPRLRSRLDESIEERR